MNAETRSQGPARRVAAAASTAEQKQPGRLRAWWSRWFGRQQEPPAPEPPPPPSRARLHYDAAARDRRNTWNDPRTARATDAAASTWQLGTVRNVARALGRNDPYARSGVSATTSALVGNGVTVSANTGDKGLDTLTDALIADWWEECYSDGQLDAIGYQRLAADTIVESGEVFVRRFVRRETDPLPIRMQLELFEGDQVDDTKTERLTGRAKIVQGVEFNGRGQRVAYHFHQEHPGSSLYGFSPETVRVSARSISHAYRYRRPGQVRGMSWLDAVIVRLGILNDHDIAELDRRRGEASIFVSVEDMSGEGDAGNVFGPQNGEEEGWPIEPAVDLHGGEIERTQSTMVAYLAPRKTLKQHAPASVGGYAEYRLQQLAGIAAGLEMAYVVLTGDWSRTNFSSAKAALGEFRQAMASVRETMFVRLICQRPLWEWPIEIAIDQGLLPRTWNQYQEGHPLGDQPIRYRPKWSPPEFASLDPVKDVQAMAIKLANKLIGWGDLIRGLGGVPEDVLADIDKWSKEFRKRGHAPPWNAGIEAGEGEPPEDEDDEDENEDRSEG